MIGKGEIYAKNHAGIHHITAFVNDAQRTIDFYSGVLGLRLVKKTINFETDTERSIIFILEMNQVHPERSLLFSRGINS